MTAQNFRHFALFGVLMACSGGGDDDTALIATETDTDTDTDADADADADTDSDTDADTDADTEPQVTAEPDPLEPISGTCPDLTGSGTSTLTSDGITRTVQIYLPATIEPDMPVLTLWHYLGGNASEMASIFGAQDIADSHGAVVVIPEARPDNLFEWDYWMGGGSDLVLYDDLRSCMADELDIDLTRMYASGISAGALWTTFLSLERGGTLAAVIPFSGGLYPFGYSTPDYAFPALLMWGGDIDTWGYPGVFKVDFQDATLAYSDGLIDDGHFVVHCNHGLGHVIPWEGSQVAQDWLFPHSLGLPSPFEGSDVAAEFASYCEVP